MTAAAAVAAASTAALKQQTCRASAASKNRSHAQTDFGLRTPQVFVCIKILCGRKGVCRQSIMSAPAPVCHSLLRSLRRTRAERGWERSSADPRLAASFNQTFTEKIKKMYLNHFSFREDVMHFKKGHPRRSEPYVQYQTPFKEYYPRRLKTRVLLGHEHAVGAAVHQVAASGYTARRTVQNAAFFVFRRGHRLTDDSKTARTTNCQLRYPLQIYPRST